MEIDWGIQYLRYEDLRVKAEDFLSTYHPEGTLPIPIEEIIEFQLGMDIVPLPGLQAAQDIDGCLSRNLKLLYVDDYVMKNRERRYRFTLAHEIGHFTLHKKVFELARYSGTHEWKAFYHSIPEEERGWFDWQANSFAGLILVPANDLFQKARECMHLLESHGIEIQLEAEAIWHSIHSKIAKEFNVSAEVISWRFYYDKLKNKLLNSR